MTPQERELIMKVAGRVQQAPPQTKDPEAEQLIREQMARQPDATYLLTQAVIVQEYGLEQAQQRIQDLEQELTQARSAPAANSGGGSFLSGLFGGGASPANSAAPPSATSGQARPPPAGKAPARSGARAANQNARQGADQRSAPGQSAQGQPAAGRSGVGDFMRNAAMMAVGVAGGQMLFSGLQGMFSDNNTSPETATADMASATDDANADAGADAGADNSADAGSDDSGGWGADQGVSEEALSGDPALWDQTGADETAADTEDAWGGGGDDSYSDAGMDADGFDDGGDAGGDDFGGDDDWG